MKSTSQHTLVCGKIFSWVNQECNLPFTITFAAIPLRLSMQSQVSCKREKASFTSYQSYLNSNCFPGYPSICIFVDTWPQWVLNLNSKKKVIRFRNMNSSITRISIWIYQVIIPIYFPEPPKCHCKELIKGHALETLHATDDCTNFLGVTE